MHISTVVVPAAGYGTRFLPYTKSIPKEMVPLVDMPALHMITQEAINAGASNLCYIISKEKTAIPDYFSYDAQLSQYLEKKQALARIQSVQELITACTMQFVLQEDAKGLGHAVLMAKDQITDPFFGVMLPDDIIINQPSALEQLVACAQTYNASVLAVCEVDPQQVSSYGVIRPGTWLSDTVVSVTDLVEKPHPSQAPSNLAIVGRYILSKTIFQALETTRAEHTGEIQLTDAIASLMHQHKQPVVALKLQGVRFDIGTPLGWLKANLHMALSHPVYGPQMRTFAQSELAHDPLITSSSRHAETVIK